MIKRFSILSILVVFALVLTACGVGNTEDDTVPVETVDLTQGIPAATREATTVPDTGELDTPTLAATQIEATSAPAVQPTMDTAQATRPVQATPTIKATNTVQAKPTTRATQNTGRQSINYLSTLLGFQVVDRYGTILGTANDFVVNMCEAHILYIVLDLDPSLASVETGGVILIPYEVATLEDGQVDVTTHTIRLNLDAEDLAGAPVFAAADLDLVVTSWEADLQAFWTGITPLSLSTKCRVPGNPANSGGQSTPNPTEAGNATVEATANPTAEATANATAGATITATEAVTATAVPNQNQNSTATPRPGGNVVVTYRNMLASDLLTAQVQSGNGQPLATVEEVIVVPETGRLSYLVVKNDTSLDAGQGLVLVPVGAVNVKIEGQRAVEGVLVLLVETQVLLDAPTVNEVPAAQGGAWDADSFDYWKQFVPLTRDDLRS